MKPPERFHQNHGYPLQKEKRMKNLNAGPMNRWRGLVFLCISLLVISLDNTVVNVALLSISNQLGGSDTDLQWIEMESRATFTDRKSTRLNSSHVRISYAVFCLKKKTMTMKSIPAPL